MLLHRLTGLAEGASREKVAPMLADERARLGALAGDILDDAPRNGPASARMTDHAGVGLAPA